MDTAREKESIHAEILFRELTKAFENAFIKAENQGIDVKGLYLFKSEKAKDLINERIKELKSS